MKCFLVSGALAALFAAGCAHPHHVDSVHVEESGTYAVSTPGALTIVHQGTSGAVTCTLRTDGGGHGKRGRGMPPGAGPAPLLDALLFRLCEARANSAISPEQYATSVQLVLKTMSDVANRPPPPRMPGPFPGAMRPPPGMPGGWNRPGMRDRGWRDRDDDRDRDRDEWRERDHDRGPDGDRHGPPGKPDDRPGPRDGGDKPKPH